MPFLVAAAPLLAAGATAAGAGATTAALVGGGAALAGGLAANSAAKSANAKAADAAKIDINALDEQTRKIAKQNALDSAALEAQLTPEVPQLRTQSNEALLAGLNDTTLGDLSSGLSGSGGYNYSLLNSAISKAAEQLALGGNLDPELQNLVTRRSLANAGTVAPGSVSLGRDLTARDLGLTRMDILNQRINTAAGPLMKDIIVSAFLLGISLIINYNEALTRLPEKKVPSGLILHVQAPVAVIAT